MLRKTFFAVLTVFTMAASSQAAIMLEQSAPTDAGQGLVSYVLSAVGDAGENINGVAAPSIVANNGGMGLHQVWLNNTGTFRSANEGDQTAGLWRAEYTPFDSFFFFTPTNSLSFGANFTDENNGTGGATGLPDGALGTPYTGFGSIHTVGDAAGSKGFTIGSGLQGSDVDFAQLVMKQGESVLVNMNVLTDAGVGAVFEEVCFGACDVTPDVLSIVDAINTPVFAGPEHTHQFELLLNDSPVDPSTATWELLSLQGPGGEVPTNAASLSPSGLLSWLPDFADLLGETDELTAVPWTASVRATLDNLTDDGTKRIELFVPEPGTAMLLSLAIAGVFGFIRRR